MTGGWSKSGSSFSSVSCICQYRPSSCTYCGCSSVDVFSIRIRYANRNLLSNAPGTAAGGNDDEGTVFPTQLSYCYIQMKKNYPPKQNKKKRIEEKSVSNTGRIFENTRRKGIRENKKTKIQRKGLTD